MEHEQRDQQEHELVQQLLSWSEAPGLSDAERERIDAHAARCPRCAADLRFERTVRQAPPGMPTGLDPERALARLMPRLGDRVARAQPTLSAVARVRAWLGGGAWMHWALVGQTAVIALLAATLLVTHEEPIVLYRALSSGSSGPAGQVMVVFRADATMADVQRLLQSGAARVVDGPTVTGAYVLKVPQENKGPWLAGLKGNRLVEMAESLDARATP